MSASFCGRGLLAFVAIATLATGSEVAAQTTATQISNAILGQGGVPLVEVDITENGVVDARDLACFVANCNPASIEFVLASSEVAEGVGTVQLQLNLSRSAYCTLNYSIDGPATIGVDYAATTGTITLAGASASIPITILDDSALDEELEPILVSIEAGSCYQPGAVSVHSLHLLDNDNVWFGTLEAQVPGSSPPVGSGELLGFRLEVVRSGASSTATLASDGTGTLPPGNWGATSFSHGETSYNLAISPVTVVASTTAFATSLQRTFSFAASDGTPGQEVQPKLVRGSYTESIVPLNPGSAHLETTVNGRFTLIQGLPRPSSWQPPLDPSP